MAETQLTSPSLQQIRPAAMQGLLWLGGDQLARRGLDVLFTVVLARILFPRDFGLLAMAATATTLVRVFAHVGLGSAVIQRRDVDEEYLATAFWANLAAGVLLAGITAALGKVVGALLSEPMVGPVVLALSIRFVITPWANVQQAILSRRMNFRAQALVSVQATAFAGLLALGMAYAGMGVWSLVGQTLGEYAVITILLYRSTGWIPRVLFSWRKFRDVWSFGAPLLLSRLLAYCIRNLDNLLIGRFLGSAALGFYALGYTIFLAPIQDVGLIANRVMFSALSRLQDDSDRFRRAFLLATQYVTLVALPMMVGIALVAPLFVEILFGSKWLPAAPVISILALAGFLQLMTTLGPSGLQAAGRPDLHLRRFIIATLLYIPAFAIGLRWGIIGVAAGYFIATCILTPVQFGLVARATGVAFSEIWEAIYPSVLGSAVMAAGVASASLALRGAGAPKSAMLALLVVLGAVVYVGVVWVVRRQTLLDLVQILRQAVPASARSTLKKAGEA